MTVFNEDMLAIGPAYDPETEYVPEPEYLADDEEVFEAMETAEMIDTPALLKRKATKRLIEDARRAKEAAEVIKELPESGETFHFISTGRYDFYDLAPVVQKLIGKPCHFIGTVWIMNREILNKIVNSYDAEDYLSFTLLTGEYFRQRNPGVFGTMVQEAGKRNQRVAVAKSHAKAMLIAPEGDGPRIVIEASANFTRNNYVENFALTNDGALHDFHKKWITELVRRAQNKQAEVYEG